MKIHFHRILCATDLSDFSNSAVIQAIGMAREFGSTLYICHVVDLPMVTMHGAAYVYQEDQIEEMKTGAMDQIRALVSGSDLKWEALVETGPVSSTLCRLALEKQADLAIVSTHGRTGLKRLFLGSVTERLLRTIACPLLEDVNLSGACIEGQNVEVEVELLHVQRRSRNGGRGVQ